MRRRQDSNLRYLAIRPLSRRLPSTTQPLLHREYYQKNVINTNFDILLGLFVSIYYTVEYMSTKNNVSGFTRTPYSIRCGGFTLIELLVVLAIIALLASVIFTSMGSIQKKSRDIRRMEDVNSIVKALELYQVGRNRFPVSVATTTLDGTDAISTAIINDGAIQAMPLDPLHPDYSYQYTTNNLGTDFTIHFCLEGGSIPGYSAGCANSITP